MIFIGDDWSEGHHDIEVQNEAGEMLERGRLDEDVSGLAKLHEWVAAHCAGPGEVLVGIETDRGLWVAALAAAGYRVFAFNPKTVARYRERYSTSGAKSDRGDAKLLADLLRTDAHNHREAVMSSPQGEAIQVLARAHQRLIWSRRTQANAVRSVLREFFPGALAAFGNDPSGTDAVAILSKAPTPVAARGLTKASLTSILRRAGRSRLVEARVERLQAALRAPQIEGDRDLADAYGAAVKAGVAVLAELNRQIHALEETLTERFAEHRDAAIYESQPGLGPVIASRLLGEFGDNAERFESARARRNYAGTSPITIASGKSRVVRSRFAHNRHIADACYWWAFCSLTHSSGARAFYDQRRARGDGNDKALRALGNKLVGILDGCLRSATPYDEDIAWPKTTPDTDEGPAVDSGSDAAAAAA